MKKIFLNLPAQEAIPGQAVNVALGQFGLNVSKFLKEFNEKSIIYPKSFLINIVVFISSDKTFTILFKGPSILFLLKSLLNETDVFSKKDLLFLLFIIRFYRKDLFFLDDFSLCKSLIGLVKSFNPKKKIFFNAS